MKTVIKYFERPEKVEVLYVSDLGFVIDKKSIVYPINVNSESDPIDWENGTIYHECTDEFKRAIPLDVLEKINNFIPDTIEYKYDSITVKRFDDEREYYQTILVCYGEHTYCNTDQDELAQISQEVLEDEAEVVTINERQFVSFQHPIALRFVPVNLYKTVYERIQYYGGAEEGGWYYHNQVPTDIDPDSVTLGLNQYGEGLILEEELIQGMLENTAKPIYC